MTTRKIPLIIGNIGADNLGDELMLESLIYNLKISSFYAFSRTEDAFKHKSDVKRIGSLYDFFLNIRNFDSVILNGGTYFHDDYAFSRNIRHFLYLSRIVVIFLISRIYGKKVLAVGQGIGPLNSLPFKLLTIIFLSLVDIISTRDEASYKIAKKYSLRSRKIYNGFDIALNIPIDRMSEKIFKTNESKTKIGISLTKPSFGFSDVYVLIDKICVIFDHNRNICIDIFEIRGGSRESDREISLNLYNRLLRIDERRVTYNPYSEDTSDTIDKVSKMDYIVAMRFHFLVLGFLLNKPCLAVCYHNKLEEFSNIINNPIEQTMLYDELRSRKLDKINNMTSTSNLGYRNVQEMTSINVKIFKMMREAL